MCGLQISQIIRLKVSNCTRMHRCAVETHISTRMYKCTDVHNDYTSAHPGTDVHQDSVTRFVISVGYWAAQPDLPAVCRCGRGPSDCAHPRSLRHVPQDHHGSIYPLLHCGRSRDPSPFLHVGLKRSVLGSTGQ
jgi:hypothetical protein